MQSTFTVPNGSTPRWAPAIQVQPMVQQAHTGHASQIHPSVLPPQRQLMVVHPSNQVQYQMNMNQAGWRNQQMNTAQMTMAYQTWKADKSVPTDVNLYRWQQENVRLQQQYQLLHSEYTAALIQIQTLTLQHNELDKKLKIDQWKYRELNNKFMIAMQSEQGKYNVLSNMQTETSNQLHREQGKNNALSINLEESTKNLKNEQKKYRALSAKHAETKQTLELMRQKRDEEGEVFESKSKFESDKGEFKVGHQIVSRERPAKPMLEKSNLQDLPIAPRGSLSSTIDPIQINGGNATTERSNHLIIPPGFESCTRISGEGVGKLDRVVTR